MPAPTDPADHVLKVKVVPGASRDRIVGMLGEALKVAVAAPPEAGAANEAVVRLLAGALGVPPKQVEIIRGHGSPHKQVRIAGVTAQRVAALTGGAAHVPGRR